MIRNTSELSPLHLSRATSMFIVDCCQIGPNWMFGLKMVLWPVPNWLTVQRSKYVFPLTLYDIINDIYTFKLYVLHLRRDTAIFVVDCCQFGPSWMFGLKMELMDCSDLVGGKTEWICLYSVPDMIVSIIWKTPELSALHLSSAIAIFVVDCCQFGPSWVLGLEMELVACANLVGGITEESCLFLTLYDSINNMKCFWFFFHYSSAVPHPFLLLIAANLAQAGFLGWKWGLWSVPDWLDVQRSKAVFFLTLNYIINDMKYFWNFCITPQPCHIHFCCWLLPIWP